MRLVIKDGQYITWIILQCGYGEPRSEAQALATGQVELKDASGGNRTRARCLGSIYSATKLHSQVEKLYQKLTSAEVCP